MEKDLKGKKKLSASGNNLIVEMDDVESHVEEKTSKGIILPMVTGIVNENASIFRNHPFQGLVISAGEGCKYVHDGDTVFLRFPQVWKSPDIQMPIAGSEAGKTHVNPIGYLLVIGEKNYRVINENEVLAIAR